MHEVVIKISMDYHQGHNFITVFAESRNLPFPRQISEISKIYISQRKIAYFLLNRGIPQNCPFFEMFCIVLANRTSCYTIKSNLIESDYMLQKIDHML